MDFRHVTGVIAKGLQHRMRGVEETHRKKLVNLGLPYQGGKLCPQDVITNLSRTKLTKAQETALSLGLDFRFNPNKLNYNSYFLGMEKLFKNLSDCGIHNESHDTSNLFRTKFKSLALETYYKFQPRQSPFQKEMISALNQLKSNKHLVITKPDKGNGTVIMDREHEYLWRNDLQYKEVTVSFSRSVFWCDLYRTRLVKGQLG